MNIEAIDLLNRLNESGSIAYADYSHLHDLLTSGRKLKTQGLGTCVSGLLCVRLSEAKAEKEES